KAVRSYSRFTPGTVTEKDPTEPEESPPARGVACSVTEYDSASIASRPPNVDNSNSTRTPIYFPSQEPTSANVAAKPICPPPRGPFEIYEGVPTNRTPLFPCPPTHGPD